ncbi:MAG: hemerythrin family protein [Deltaproteobacteria bacterium]|nr:hemerythrin family protein [Deltaproteobacteria bacterium]
MALFQWNDSFSVDVAIFNTHHKKLVELINELYEAMRVGKGPQAVGGVLKSLLEYTKVHFSSEQYLMAAHNYPGYEEHKREHDELVKKVTDLMEKQSRGTAVTVEVFNFLKDWLSNHIMTTDKKYGAFFNDKGIK